MTTHLPGLLVHPLRPDPLPWRLGPLSREVNAEESITTAQVYACQASYALSWMMVGNLRVLVFRDGIYLANEEADHYYCLPDPNAGRTTPSTTSPTASPTAVAVWGQCGGQGYSGPTKCVNSTCVWMDQCKLKVDFRLSYR